MSRRRNRFGGSKWIPLAVILLLAVLYVISREEQNQPKKGIDRGLDLEKVMTNPSEPEEIVEYEGMTVSFNPLLHIPNWAAWELTGDETNGVSGRMDFQTDDNVKGCASPRDYTRSGYDRGHMVPAGDMKWSDKAMRSTFYMTNICPQLHSLNSGAWKNLEEKCRVWAERDSAIVIVCGPVFRKPLLGHIGENRVAVPAEFFKVILAPYVNPPRAIGFIMPNGYVKGGMQACAMSVDDVEAATGHDFFAELPDSIENIIEAKSDFHYWSTLK